MKEFNLLTQTLEPGTTLIEASAGTGKTHNIEHLYLRFIVEKDFTPDQILVVTFSREATAELKLRITRNLSHAEKILLDGGIGAGNVLDIDPADQLLFMILKRALEYVEDKEVLRRIQFAVRAMDEAAILTIHGFCLSVLTDYAFESGSLFGVELVDDRNGLFDDLLGDFLKKFVAYRDDFEGELLRKYLSVDSLKAIAPLVYGKDDVVVVGEVPTLPDVSELYSALLFEDFIELRKQLKSKRGTRAYIILDFLESHPKPSDSDLLDFIGLVNGAVVSDIVKKSKYFQAVFHQDFQDIILKLRTVPDIISLTGCRLFVDYINQYYSESNNSEEKSKLVFDDLLYLTRAAIKAGDARLVKRVREAYSAVLVDEFQDTSSVQFDVFNSLFGGGATPFFMIGDPKQSIYAFRDADIFSYLKAVNSDDVSRATLSKNFRSTPECITAMNCLFENRISYDNHALPFIFDEIEYINVDAGRNDSRRLTGVDESAPLEIRWRDNGEVIKPDQAEREIIRSVADDIALKLNASQNGLVGFTDGVKKEALKPSNFAVLVDKNKQGEAIRVELNKRGVVGVLLKSGSVFDSIEADELGVILKAVVNSRSESAVMAALSTRCFEYSITQLALYRCKDVRLLDYWAEFFFDLEQVLNKYGFLSAFTILFEREHYSVSHPSLKAVLATSENGERAITNYLQLVEILEMEILNKGDVDSNVYDILQNLRRSNSNSEEFEMRLESDDDAVKIMTVHKSKGLQFPVVYVPFLYSSVKDKTKFSKPVTCHCGDGTIGLILSQEDMNLHSARLELEERAERMRLLYVAVTRAVDKCIIYGGNIKNIERSALADVFDQDFSRLSTLNESEYISVVSEWKDTGIVFNQDIKSLNLYCPEFEACIEQEWGVMSYSSLVSHEFISHDVRSDVTFAGDEDDEGVVSVIDNLDPLISSNMVGSAVHEVIEESNFTVCADAFDQELIHEKLRKYGVVSSNSTLVSADLQIKAVDRVLSIISALQLFDSFGSEFNLSDVPANGVVSEMSFYFPVRDKISTERLCHFFKERGLQSYREQESFTEVISGLGLFLQNKGFREGFLFGLIDLVFEYNGRFYFADWKTNNLSRYGGYSPESVLASMGESGYLLQFYIYTVALNLFLRSRIPDFDYSKHFGGGYYLYVRGVELDRPDRGVFYEVPSEEDVNELIDIFTGGHDNG